MNYRITDDGDALRGSAGDGAELARAVRISLCGIDLEHPASFLPASPATADFDWQAWLGDVFKDELGPAFVEVFLAAGQMQVRELMTVDAWLKGERCREAGAALLDRLEQAKNCRVIERMRAILADRNVTGPHFTTAFAVECAEFHLPLRSALLSYLYGEWRCGMSALGERGDLDAFSAAGGELVSTLVGELLSKSASPFDQAAGL